MRFFVQLLIGLVIASSFVQADAKKSELSQQFKEKVKKLAIEFEMQKAKQELQNKFSKKKPSLLVMHDRSDCPPPYDPPPSRSACINVACDALGTFGCDEQREIDEVADMCRGVDGTCVRSACQRVGTFGCDEMREVRQIAAACRGAGGTCLDESCGFLGTFGCDEVREVQEVTLSCRGVEDGCVTAVCERLGTYGCDELREIQQVTQNCAGRME